MFLDYDKETERCPCTLHKTLPNAQFASIERTLYTRGR